MVTLLSTDSMLKLTWFYLTRSQTGTAGLYALHEVSPTPLGHDKHFLIPKTVQISWNVPSAGSLVNFEANCSRSKAQPTKPESKQPEIQSFKEASCRNLTSERMSFKISDASRPVQPLRFLVQIRPTSCGRLMRSRTFVSFREVFVSWGLGSRMASSRWIKVSNSWASFTSLISTCFFTWGKINPKNCASSTIFMNCRCCESKVATFTSWDTWQKPQDFPFRHEPRANWIQGLRHKSGWP